MKQAGLAIVIVLLMAGCVAEKSEEAGSMKNQIVVLETSKGDIEIQLNGERAPITVQNFIGYVNDGFYDGLIFHRVIDGFMIQGGGFDPQMNQKPTKSPIKNEAGNGLKNEQYSIAMARTGVVDSATAQFFINVADNDFLDHRDDSQQGFGYSVFGQVIKGQEVVGQIKSVPTATGGMYENIPLDPVIITKAYVK